MQINLFLQTIRDEDSTSAPTPNYIRSVGLPVARTIVKNGEIALDAMKWTLYVQIPECAKTAEKWP